MTSAHRNVGERYSGDPRLCTLHKTDIFNRICVLLRLAAALCPCTLALYAAWLVLAQHFEMRASIKSLKVLYRSTSIHLRICLWFLHIAMPRVQGSCGTCGVSTC